LIEILIKKDKELLVFLNSLGSEQWDGFWLAITNQFHWIPLFAFVFFLIIKAFGWKKGSFFIVATLIFVGFSDQFTNLIKDSVMRLRPNNDISINHLLRTSITPQSFSFVSGHATTSTAFAVFIIFLLREKYKHIKFILLFPIFFAYSRLYLGVHFPIDIFCGFLTGITLAFIFYKLVIFLEKKLIL